MKLTAEKFSSNEKQIKVFFQYEIHPICPPFIKHLDGIGRENGINFASSDFILFPIRQISIVFDSLVNGAQIGSC